MFSHIKTNFEQTLRARIFPVTPKQNGNNPGLNPDFHRGCTGKAHACGTAKSRLMQHAANNTTTTTNNSNTSASNSNVTNAGKKQVQRKNSISSETISDSGSENSAPSWLDTTDCVANGKVAKSSSHNCIGEGGKTPEVKKRVFQLKRHNCNENVSIISKNSGKLLPRKSHTPTNSTDRRRRLYSEGDRMSETGASNASTSSINVTQQQQQQQNKLKQQQKTQHESTFERIQKYRSFRVGNNSLRKALKTSTTTPAATTTTRPITPNNIRPPWNSGSTNKTTMTSVSPTFNTRNYRNSLRRRDVTDWPTIWERSFAIRGAAAAHSECYKNYNEAIKRKNLNGAAIKCGTPQYLFIRAHL